MSIDVRLDALESAVTELAKDRNDCLEERKKLQKERQDLKKDKAELKRVMAEIYKFLKEERHDAKRGESNN